MYTPTPVTAVTQEELVKMAPTNVIDSLAALPQFFGNNTFQQALGGQSPSGSQVNLRGANTEPRHLTHARAARWSALRAEQSIRFG